MIGRSYLSVVYLCMGLGFTPVQSPGRTVALFDGRTFAGWSGDTTQTWRISKGALVGGSLTQQVPHNEFLCTTRSYANFDLRLEFRLVGTGFVNAGVQFRSQRATQPAYEMIGYQADLGNGFWASLYDESRRDRTLAAPDANLVKRVLRPDGWNAYRIRCTGRRIQIWLNDQPTVDYTETDPAIPQAGLIGLQIHGGGRAEASYKAIQLTELP